ncbi:MAG TPA: pilus assembly PilX N-terminal domain-containing protein [Candidatus Paceibacterota bacterium]|nr:pilus assembly PilX N-terminal domain-containing protein [Candidatus Paceibacterota bacterium]
MLKQQGFILNFTLLFVAIMLLIVVVTTNSTVAVLQSARNEVKSEQAFYAADMGVECARFLESKYNAFDTTSPQATYTCGIGASFQAGKDPVDPQLSCSSAKYTFTVDGLGNGACTDVEVDVTPQSVNLGGTPATLCSVTVYSNGKSSCTDTTGVVERTRWETIK